MQWWCSAQGVSWSWTWQPYVGVWIFIGLVAAAYARLFRSAGPPRDGEAARDRRWRVVWAACGILVLWAALDWPIGALGAGYLASVHMLQYILISLISAPLLLLGVPRESYARLARPGAPFGALRRLTHPGVAVLVFNAVAIVTHIPGVVDTLMATQAGSFVFDLAWLLAALLFWWPVVAPVPVRPGFPLPLRAIYLFLGTMIHSAVSIWLVYSGYPVYATYELAPPTGWVTALEDQQVAGALMLVVGNTVLWVAIGMLFFRFMGRTDPGAEPVPA